MLDRVNSLQEIADRSGFSLATLRRLIDRGEGPKITQLSPRRAGVRDSHYIEWFDARPRHHDEAAAHAGEAAA